MVSLKVFLRYLEDDEVFNYITNLLREAVKRLYLLRIEVFATWLRPEHSSNA